MKSETIDILLIEDDPDDALLIEEMLAEGMGAVRRFEFEHANRLSTGLELLTAKRHKVVLLDLNLPDSSGLETVEAILASGTEAAVIMMTGLSDESLGVEAIRKGAQDYLVKGRIDAPLLQHSIIYAVERKRIQDELCRSNAELSALYKVSLAVSRTMELNTVFAEILDTVADLGILDEQLKGVIFSVEGDKLELVYSRGVSAAFVGLHSGLRLGDCLCGIAAKTGEIIVSDDSRVDPRHTIQYDGMCHHGHIVIPLKAKEEVFGVLCLYFPSGTRIDHGKLRLFTALSAQLGLAIENARLFEETKALSLRDPLTGLANRRFLEIMLKECLARAERNNNQFSVIFFDVDHFKVYNDTCGHDAGDRILICIADLVSKNTRKADLFARYGGEEFLLLLTEADAEAAALVAEGVRRSIEVSCGVTVSLGVALYRPGMDMHDIISKADHAMYEAKKGGRNRVVCL